MDSAESKERAHYRPFGNQNGDNDEVRVMRIATAVLARLLVATALVQPDT